MSSLQSLNPTSGEHFQQSEEDAMSNITSVRLESLKTILKGKNTFSFRRDDYTQDEWNQLIKDLEILRTRKIIEIAAYKKTSGIDDVVLDIKKGKLWNS
jgi:hypothetical protein